ncbi:RIP metalloprotease RseP [Candidatus Bipolaricaulota bacterium]|nr:RIP metalloprotease RseP [Candidatus Bipolaricaulota bacterium]
MTTVLIFAGTLLILVGVHEGGHFLAAKLTGVYVHEFAIGFGPKILSFQRRETRYSLRAIPFGGYVKLAGEDRQEENEDIPTDRLLYSKPPWVRILISLAGPAANLLTTLIVILLVLWGFGMPLLQVAGLVEGEPAEQFLRPGDVVLAIDDQPVYSIESLARIVQRAAGSPVSVRIERDGEVKTYAITPQYLHDEDRYVVGAYFLTTTYTNELSQVDPSSIFGRAGITAGDRIVAVGGEPVITGVEVVDRLGALLPSDSIPLTLMRGGAQLDVSIPSSGYEVTSLIDGIGFADTGIVVRRPGFASGIVLGAGQFAGYINMMVSGLRDVITRRIAASKAIAGPVGIANLLGEGFRQGPSIFLQIFSYLSLSLGLFNLIPFPALDGSRAAFALYEVVRGRPIPPEKEGMVHLIGFFILIGLMLLITYQDIIKLFH